MMSAPVRMLPRLWLPLLGMQSMFTETTPVKPAKTMSGSSRNLLVALGVVAFHVLGVWALHTGLLRRTVELLVPVEILSELIEPPKPVVAPPPPTPPKPIVARQPITRPTPQRVAPAPELQAAPNPDPAPNAPTAIAAPPAPLPPITAPVAVATAPPPPPPPAPAPPRIQLPSSDAEFLQNQKPSYPPLSRRLGEQGTVMVEVLVGVDGTVQRVGIKRSSGFDRLDQAALSAVRRWRFVPGKVAGVPVEMLHDAPIDFYFN